MTARGEPGPRVWLLADDRPGNRTQVLGVGEALGWPFVEQSLAYRRCAELPNLLLGAAFAGLNADSRRRMVAPWPDLVIAAGRRTAPVARAIKRRAAGRTFLCQLMDPGPPRSAFDLIAVPRHDRPPQAGNVLIVTGAPHRITAAALARAGDVWRPRFRELPAPRIALLVGGTVKRRIFTDAMARDLGARASALAKAAGGSLLISTSRRTGPAADALMAAIEVPCHVFRWGDPGENPYLGYLACADAVIVTGDSVSMACEACAAPAPVFIHAPAGLAAAKHARLHDDLFAAGHARPLTDASPDMLTEAPSDASTAAPRPPPLDAATQIAREIARRLGLR